MKRWWFCLVWPSIPKSNQSWGFLHQRLPQVLQKQSFLTGLFMLLGNLRVVTYSGANCAQNYPVKAEFWLCLSVFFFGWCRNSFFTFPVGKISLQTDSWRHLTKNLNRKVPRIVPSSNGNETTSCTPWPWFKIIQAGEIFPPHLEIQPTGNFEWFVFAFQ